MQTEPDIVIDEAPSEADRLKLLDALRDYNETQVGPLDLRLAAILLRVSGATVGGLWGRTAYDWMFVEYLVVPDAWRGRNFGTRLMHAAEQLAIRRGCVGIWLDTFSFQARGFYEKLGYRVIGTVADYPIGHQRFFMTKRLDTAKAATR